MPLKGKHVIVEIEGVRCTAVESGLNDDRKNFLKLLLEHNKYEVKVTADKKKAETDPTTYTVAVADLIFNPVVVLYEKKLRTPDNKIVSQAYWEQWKDVDYTIPYYQVNK